jgi:hypothetical protein
LSAGLVSDLPRRIGVTGTGTSTRRSTTSTADRPDAAARVCSQARCRQVAEHHFGIGPRLRGVMGPPHQAQSLAAFRRPGERFSSSTASDRFGSLCARSTFWRRRRSASARRLR